MTRNKMIEDILSRNIYHNIRIDFNKMPEMPDNFDWNSISEYMIDDFKRNFENYNETPINDCGNRNLGEGCEIRGKVWTSGRSETTLYWDAYYNESGNITLEDYQLEEEDYYNIEELKGIIKRLDKFDKMVEYLMIDFYAEVEYQVKESTEIKKAEESTEKHYQKIKKETKDNNYLKRLCNDLIN